MNQQQLLSYLVETLETLKIPYAIGGSHATMVFGRPRHTLDIDVLVDLSSSGLRSLRAAFPDSDFHTAEEGAKAAVARGGTFNIIHPTTGLKIDFFVPADEFERTEIGRAVRRPKAGGGEATFVAPEDIIIMKMRYFEMGESDKHLTDSAIVLQSLGDKVDREYIEQWVKYFGLEAIWELLLKRVESK
jgi:hypothetical protein